MASYGAGKYARAAEGGAVAIRGFAGLQAALRRIEDGTQAELRKKILEIGAQVAIVAASNAPRLDPSRVTSSSGFSGELQHSIKVGAFSRGASVYSTAVYGGALNYGAWSAGRGPHIKRANASHYMDRAVDQLAPYVVTEMDSVMEWLMTTFMEG